MFQCLSSFLKGEQGWKRKSADFSQTRALLYPPASWTNHRGYKGEKVTHPDLRSRKSELDTKEAELSLGKTKEQNLLCISSLCTHRLLGAELVLTHRSQQGQHSSLAGCSGKPEGDGCASHGAAPWAQKTTGICR